MSLHANSKQAPSSAASAAARTAAAPSRPAAAATTATVAQRPAAAAGATKRVAIFKIPAAPKLPAPLLHLLHLQFQRTFGSHEQSGMEVIAVDAHTALAQAKEREQQLQSTVQMQAAMIQALTATVQQMQQGGAGAGAGAQPISLAVAPPAGKSSKKRSLQSDSAALPVAAAAALSLQTQAPKKRKSSAAVIPAQVYLSASAAAAVVQASAAVAPPVGSHVAPSISVQLVMQYLSLEELCIASTVCRTWRAASASSVVWVGRSTAVCFDREMRQVLDTNSSATASRNRSIFPRTLRQWSSSGVFRNIATLKLGIGHPRPPPPRLNHPYGSGVAAAAPAPALAFGAALSIDWIAWKWSDIRACMPNLTELHVRLEHNVRSKSEEPLLVLQHLMSHALWKQMRCIRLECVEYDSVLESRLRNPTAMPLPMPPAHTSTLCLPLTQLAQGMAACLKLHTLELTYKMLNQPPALPQFIHSTHLPHQNLSAECFRMLFQLVPSLRTLRVHGHAMSNICGSRGVPLWLELPVALMGDLHSLDVRLRVDQVEHLCGARSLAALRTLKIIVTHSNAATTTPALQSRRLACLARLPALSELSITQHLDCTKDQCTTDTMLLMLRHARQQDSSAFAALRSFTSEALCTGPHAQGGAASKPLPPTTAAEAAAIKESELGSPSSSAVAAAAAGAGGGIGIEGEESQGDVLQSFSSLTELHLSTCLSDLLCSGHACFLAILCREFPNLRSLHLGARASRITSMAWCRLMSAGLKKLQTLTIAYHPAWTTQHLTAPKLVDLFALADLPEIIRVDLGAAVCTLSCAQLRGLLTLRATSEDKLKQLEVQE